MASVYSRWDVAKEERLFRSITPRTSSGFRMFFVTHDRSSSLSRTGANPLERPKMPGITAETTGITASDDW